MEFCQTNEIKGPRLSLCCELQEKGGRVAECSRALESEVERGVGTFADLCIAPIKISVKRRFRLGEGPVGGLDSLNF